MICLLLLNLCVSLSANGLFVQPTAFARAECYPEISYMFSNDTHAEAGGKLAPLPQY